MMRRKNRFWGKFYTFLIILFGLAALGFTYANWNSSLFIDAKLTSGVMDILFHKHADEKYAVSLTNPDGDDAVLVGAEFNVKDKEVEISFKEGLPVKQLVEGKLLRLEFPLVPSKDSTVTRLNYTKFDPSKTGEDLELKVEKAVLVNGGVGYSLGDNEALFTEPLKFEVYKILSDNKKRNTEETGGQIYLRLQDESIEKLNTLPTNLSVSSDELLEYTDLDLKERELMGTIGNGVVVTYSCEIPFDILQRVNKVQGD